MVWSQKKLYERLFEEVYIKTNVRRAASAHFFPCRCNTLPIRQYNKEAYRNSRVFVRYDNGRFRRATRSRRTDRRKLEGLALSRIQNLCIWQPIHKLANAPQIASYQRLYKIVHKR